MNIDDAYPSKYLSAEDLRGGEPTVVIATADYELVGQEQKIVLTFQGKKKAMVCNKTNAKRIAFMYGNETDDWIGREVVLCSEFTTFQGKPTQALRVKPPAQKPMGVFADRKISGGGTIVDSTANVKTPPQKPRNDMDEDPIPF